MKRTVLMLAIASQSALAVEVSEFFTHDMVLQRDKPAAVWGRAAAGEKVCVRYGEPSWFFGLGDTTVETTAGADGRWRVELKPMAACAEGKALHVIGERGETCFTNVVVGDVWVCSGQSNMQMPLSGDNPFWRAANHLDELANCGDPLLRVIRIPWRTNGVRPEEDLEPAGPWYAVSPETALKNELSACAYFFGRQIRRDEKIPVGLVQVPWSGSSIKPWISLEGYRAAGLESFVRQIEGFAKRMKDPKANPLDCCYSGRDAARQQAAWRARFDGFDPAATGAALANWARADYDDSAWKACPDVQGDMVPSPHPWENGKLVKGGAFPPGKDGVQWYRQAVTLTPAQAGGDAELHLGNVDDEDTTWFNGEKVGSCTYCMAKRVYRIPARLIRPGRNVIAVRAVDVKMYGCFNMPEEQRLVLCDGKAIPLAKGWKERIEYVVDPGKIGTMPTFDVWRSAKPSAMYNGMIAPFASAAVKGVIWYQGCSDAGQPEYWDWQKALIASWRTAFRDESLPFIVTELSGYEGHQPANPRADDFWKALPCKPSKDVSFAVTREIQSLASRRIPNVGVAVTIDIGNHSDIHPRNKQDVGRRLALEAERIAYGRDVVSRGPTFRGAAFDGGVATVSFDHADGLATSDGLEPGAFALQDEKGVWHWAKAKIAGETVVVSAPDVAKATAVRYAWAMYRGDCNLVNGAGLPADPFRSDAPEYK